MSEATPFNIADRFGSVLHDMEEPVTDFVRFGHLIQDLGTGNDDVRPEGLFVIGKAMLQAAKVLEAEWQRACDILRAEREAGR